MQFLLTLCIFNLNSLVLDGYQKLSKEFTSTLWLIVLVPWFLNRNIVQASTRGPNCVIAKNVKSCTYSWYVICVTLIIRLWEMPWPKTGATHYYAQLGLPDKGRARVGCLLYLGSRAFGPGGLALGCYQPSPEWSMTRMET